MNFLSHIKTAIVGLKTNKTRSFLSILGIVIGICSVIIMLLIGKGAQSAIVNEIQGLGSNLIMVMPGANEKGMNPQIMLGTLTIKTLTYEDSKALLNKNNVPYIKDVGSFVFTSCRASYGNESRATQCLGGTPNIQELYNYYTKEGRFFTQEEMNSLARVAVIGNTVKEDIFGEEDPIGKMIKINKLSFKVIGVAEERGVKGLEDQDDQLMIPLTTAQKQLLGIDYINAMIIQAESEDLIDQTLIDIANTLRERHGIVDPSKDDFNVRTFDEIAQAMSAVTGIFAMFLSSVAAIALVVGGIGIMNIMLVSVTERTREVGLRKAVGAREKDILYQFLLEAITLTGIGGIIGVLLGLLGSYGLGLILGSVLNLNWKFSFSLEPVLLAFGVSTIIGLVFGIYPAKKAAKLDPIEALRYE